MGPYDLRKSASEKAATHRGACDMDAITETLEILVKKLAGHDAVVAAAVLPPAKQEAKPEAPVPSAAPQVDPVLSEPLEYEDEEDSIFTSPWFWGVTGVVGVVVALISSVGGSEAKTSDGSKNILSNTRDSSGDTGSSSGSLRSGLSVHW